MHDKLNLLPEAVKPRKFEAFQAVLGEAPGHLSLALLNQARIMSATSNEGVILLIGPSALWLVPWVMDALQPGTRVVALVEPGNELLAERLGPLLQDDLRLAVRVQGAESFLADMGEQKFDLIVDVDAAARLEYCLNQLLAFGSLILGNERPVQVDDKECLSGELFGFDGSYAGQVIKPRPASLRRRGGRKTRIAHRKPQQQPPNELLDAFPDTNAQLGR